MSKKFAFLLFLGLVAMAITSSSALALTIEVRIAASSDDAEQHLNAGMDVGSTDIEMPYEDNGTPATDEQLACLRFLVPINKGVKVTNAYVEFTCDETKGGTAPVNLIIEGQLAVDPPAFTTAANNLTNRAPWTSAQVAWTVEDWTTAGQTSQTPNLAAIIQEIINQSDWTSGDALVLAFRDDKANPSTGIRCADAYDDDPTTAALLHIEISRAPAGAPAPADGATDVPVDTILSWAAGQYAATHDVYFGTVAEDVDNASRANPMGVLISQGQTEAQYDPEGGFEFGQTYYWRVDEVNAAPDNTVVKGSVWSFTVEPYVYPVQNILATASSAQEGAGPENTINGSGLDASDQHSVEATDMWLSDPSGEQPAWIQYEFDNVYQLYEMWVWNYNVQFEPILGFGLKDVTVEYSVDGEAWTALGDFEFAQAAANATYAHNTTLDLSGVVAKYVRLTANSNWSGMMPQSGLSEVRFYYKPAVALELYPANGQTDVGIDVTLDWRGGRDAVSHEVYLSTDEQAVIDGAALIDTATETYYTVNDLNLGTTYYWKVNEVNEAATPSLWEGSVWSFSTSTHIVVDDFEAYNDEDSMIFEAWVDGYEDPQNGGSQVGYLDSPFAEQTIVHGGRQSLPLFYTNTNSVTYSEATYTFAVPQDWTRAEATTLALWFRGDPGNAGQLYLKINGTKVLYDGLAGSLALGGWQPWNVDLTSLNLNLKSVRTLTIGVEGNGVSGTLYFDDIALYAIAPEPITDWRVAASTDDREEYANGGTMVAEDSSDLELGYEGAMAATSQQIVGCRWTGIAVPKGATITEAWVQFSADAVSDSIHVPEVSVIIEGELSPAPATFGSGAGDISNRPKTTASVVWDIPQWTVVHAKGSEERTPDISSVIQQIVNQPEWSGEAIVLTFRDNPAKPSQGTREAESYDGGADEAPLLHISYQ